MDVTVIGPVGVSPWPVTTTTVPLPTVHELFSNCREHYSGRNHRTLEEACRCLDFHRVCVLVVLDSRFLCFFISVGFLSVFFVVAFNCFFVRNVTNMVSACSSRPFPLTLGDCKRFFVCIIDAFCVCCYVLPWITLDASVRSLCACSWCGNAGFVVFTRSPHSAVFSKPSPCSASTLSVTDAVHSSTL